LKKPTKLIYLYLITGSCSWGGQKKKWSIMDSPKESFFQPGMERFEGKITKTLDLPEMKTNTGPIFRALLP